MKSKRPVLYIAAGLISAAVAVVVVHKRLSGAPAGAKPAERVEVLIAARDISYGEPLLLAGESQNANVMLVAWPKDVMPDGAIRDKAAITGQQIRACAEIAKHEVIQKRRIATDAEFVPEDMYKERVTVDQDDVKSGRFRPGMLVDVLRIVSNRPEDFMRCVRIYAVGKLDLFGHPAKDEDLQPNVFLLIKKADRLAFIEAQLGGKFRLLEAAGPAGEGAALVDQRGTPETLKKQADSLLADARRLMDEGDYEKALAELQKIIKDYGDVAGNLAEVTTMEQKCQQLAARALYDQARQAYEQQKDYAVALQLLGKVENGFPDAGQVLQDARKLRPTVETAQRNQERQIHYQSLIQRIEAALDQGNLPLVEGMLAELEQFKSEALQPNGGLPAPAQAAQDYAAKLKDAQIRFDVDRKIVESHLKQGNLEQAREKLKQMQERFAAHPQIGQLEEAVRQAGSGAQ